MISLSAAVNLVSAQEMPQLLTFSASDYSAAAQNWDFAEDCEGNLYVANSEGVLVYNGFEWELLPISTTSRARSVYRTSDCRILVGGFETIGHIVIDDTDTRVYQELPDHELKDSRQEIWNIVGKDGRMYYQSFSQLYEYSDERSISIDLPGNIMLGSMSGESLILPTIDSGIYQYEAGEMNRIVAVEEFPPAAKVSAITSAGSDGSLYLALEQQGIYHYASDGSITGPMEGPWSRSQINRMINLSDGSYAIGTISDGVYLADDSLQVTKHVTRRQGLTDNTVLALYEDRIGNLWIGSDRGINVLRRSGAERYYYDLEGILGTIYSAAEYNGVDYLGTNQGAFYQLDQSAYILIPGTEGQVWSFEQHGDDVLAAHNRGIWKFPPSEDITSPAKLIFSSTGVRQIESLTESTALIASYTGLYLIDSRSGEIITALLYDNQSIIMEAFVRQDSTLLGYHRDYGVHYVKLNRDFTTVHNYRQSPVVQITFEQSRTSKFDNSLRLDREHASYIVNQDTIYQVTAHSEQAGLHLQISADRYLVPLDGGYMIRDAPASTVTACLDHVSIDRVEGREDKLDYVSDVLRLPAGEPRLIVQLRSDRLLDQCVTEYKLSTWDELWRVLPIDGQLVFSQLPIGDHDLYIRDAQGRERRLMQVEVMPPWYASSWAVIAYILLGIVLLWVVSRIYSHRLSREKRKLYIESQRAIKEEKLKGKNKQLRQELRQKRKMLANSALILAQRNEMLTKLKSTISKAVRNGDDVTELKQKLVSRIDKHLRSESHWEIFEKNFAEIHQDFLDTLKMQYPSITSGELRLAAYIRMNLSSKEIAPLLNISVRSVENKRHRLRKKMGLSPKISLSDHIMRT